MNIYAYLYLYLATVQIAYELYYYAHLYASFLLFYCATRKMHSAV